MHPFVEEMRGGVRSSNEPVAVAVGGTNAHLAEHEGSMFELRAAVEPHVSSDALSALVV